MYLERDSKLVVVFISSHIPIFSSNVNQNKSTKILVDFSYFYQISKDFLSEVLNINRIKNKTFQLKA